MDALQTLCCETAGISLTMLFKKFHCNSPTVLYELNFSFKFAVKLLFPENFGDIYIRT